MSKIVALGEILLRLAPPGFERIVQTDSFQVNYGGGEANVCVSLANFGADVSFVSKIPENPIGQSAINALRRFGVNTAAIVRGGHRLGIYFLERGASQRPSTVLYDRAYSAISEAKPDEFDWDHILSDADWFHFTGITPALSDLAPVICLEAVKAARKRGIPVSCDLNYRKNLWSRDQARQVMSELMPFVTVCIANEEDAADVFGIHARDTQITQGHLSPAGYEQVAREICARFGTEQVAITLRESLSASVNNWSAMLYRDGQSWFARKYQMQIVDRVGGGDSFGAGLIYALLCGYSPSETIEFATAASCLKHSIEGDFNLVSIAEIKTLAGGDGSGRVQR